MKRTYRVLPGLSLWMLLHTIFLAGCAPDPEAQINAYIEAESARIQTASQQILEQIGLKPVDIIVIPQTTLDYELVSETEHLERYDGSFPPGGPAGTQEQLPPGYEDLDYDNSRYRMHDRIVNYADAGQQRTYLNYFAVIAIVEPIESAEVIEVEKWERAKFLLTEYVCNVTRGDIATVIIADRPSP